MQGYSVVWEGLVMLELMYSWSQRLDYYFKIWLPFLQFTDKQNSPRRLAKLSLFSHQTVSDLFTFLLPLLLGQQNILFCFVSILTNCAFVILKNSNLNDQIIKGKIHSLLNPSAKCQTCTNQQLLIITPILYKIYWVNFFPGSFYYRASGTVASPGCMQKYPRHW